MVYRNSPITQLLNIRIEHAGTIHPFQPYNYNFDYTSNAGANNLSNGTFRSFMDFANFSDGLRDRNGTLLNADQYTVSPIMLFKTAQHSNNENNQLLAVLDFKQAVAGCYAFVVAP